MTTITNGDDGQRANAARELAQVHAQIEKARAELARLKQQVTEAESRQRGVPTGQLLKANERLVLSALRAQTEAEDAKRVLDEVSRSAELDPLTGLPNRVLLLDRFERAVVRAKRHGTRLALLFLDLNNFKQINDTLGHAVGDQVLKLVASRLASAVRKADTVSRHGGDEFLILLPDVSEASDAARIANKVIASLCAPTRVDEHVLRLTASIGISIYPDDGEDAETLMNLADAAMYRAKTHGLGSFVFHGEEPPSERSLEAPALASLQRPMTHYELALAEHERRHEQMRDANEQLVLHALSAQEMKSAAELQQRRQTEFLAVVANELRNPLAPISTAAALLERVHQDGPPLSELRAVIERHVAQMSRLVGDLLDVSRINTGKLRLDRHIVDMASIIDAAVDACRPAMDMRLQRFEVRVPSRELQVHGDSVRLTQVLTNLLDNASKYTPNGGEIALAVAVEGDTLVMTVSDNGIGITAEALPNIFELFAQDTHAIGLNGAGLGLGLTVVRELVEAHGGKVVASSAGSDRGSQFVVTLPLSAALTVREPSDDKCAVDQ